MTATIPLGDLAAVVRSKNAGPYELTFDVIFTDRETYLHVRDSDVLTPRAMADLYRVPLDDVLVCLFFEPALAFKLTLIRHGAQGSVGERDTFGAQQHVPLMRLPIPQRLP
jgi:hypothetical protein